MSETNRFNASEIRRPVAANRLISDAYVLGCNGSGDESFVAANKVHDFVLRINVARDASADKQNGSLAAIRGGGLLREGTEQSGRWSGNAWGCATDFAWLAQSIAVAVQTCACFSSMAKPVKQQEYILCC